MTKDERARRCVAVVVSVSLVDVGVICSTENTAEKNGVEIYHTFITVM